MPPTASVGDLFMVRMKEVDGEGDCINEVRYFIEVVDRTYQATYAAGPAAKIGGKLAGLDAAVSAGAGFDATIDANTPRRPTKLTLTTIRSLGFELGAKVGSDPIARGAEWSFGQANAGVAIAAERLQTDKYAFPMPLTNAAADGVRDVFARLVLTTAAKTITAAIPGGDLIVDGLVDDLFDTLFALDDERVSRGGSVGVSAKASVQLNAVLFRLGAVDGVEAGKHGFNIGLNFAGDVGFIAGFEQQPKETPALLVPSTEFRGSIQAKCCVSGQLLDKIPDETLRKDVEAAVERLNRIFNFKADAAGSMKFELALDAATNKAKSLTISIGEKKTFGLQVEGESIIQVGDGSRKVLTAKVTDKDPAKLQRAIEQVAFANAVTVFGAINPLIYTVVDDVTDDLLDSIQYGDEYEVTVERGTSKTWPYNLLDAFPDLKLAAAAKKIGTLEVSLKVDTLVKYVVEKGIFIDGIMWPREIYPYSDPLVPADASKQVEDTLIDAFARTIRPAPIRLVARKFTVPIGIQRARLEQAFSPSGVTIDVNAEAEPESRKPYDIALVARKAREIPSADAPLLQSPLDVVVSYDRPRYGIGGFFHFATEYPTLSAPALLEVRYLDEEVAALDESSLRIYRFSDTTKDWELVGGTVESGRQQGRHDRHRSRRRLHGWGTHAGGAARHHRTGDGRVERRRGIGVGDEQRHPHEHRRGGARRHAVHDLPRSRQCRRRRAARHRDHAGSGWGHRGRPDRDRGRCPAVRGDDARRGLAGQGCRMAHTRRRGPPRSRHLAAVGRETPMMTPRFRHLVLNALVTVVALASSASGQTTNAVLGRDDIRLLGAGLRVTPARQVVPKDIATIVSTYLQAPTLPDSPLPPFAPDAIVRGTLRGPGFAKPIEITARPNTPFNLPPFSVAGLYTLDTIRLESGGEVLLYGSPESVTIEVIEKLLVTQVTARPLTAAEIREKGIVFDKENFQAYNFTAAFAVGASNPVPISFPVVLPRLEGPADVSLEGVGLSVLAPPKLPRLETIIPDTLKIQTQIPNLQVVGFTLGIPELKGKNLSVPPIPGIVVIPGDIGFLNQFFNVTLLVGNVAPLGSNLVVSELSAEIVLPPGRDNVPNSDDDPLGMARTNAGASPRVRLVMQPGSDGKLGTGDDIGSLGPSETGSAEYLVEGRREGTHVIEMQMRGTLTGLPVGPVTITGRAAGSVLVRNPTFTLTFTHPDLINSGEPYTLDVTVTNTSESPANFVSVNLHPANIAGAQLVGVAHARGRVHRAGRFGDGQLRSHRAAHGPDRRGDDRLRRQRQRALRAEDVGGRTGYPAVTRFARAPERDLVTAKRPARSGAGPARQGVGRGDRTGGCAPAQRHAVLEADRLRPRDRAGRGGVPLLAGRDAARHGDASCARLRGQQLHAHPRGRLVCDRSRLPRERRARAR